MAKFLQQPPVLKRFKWLMYISPLITVLCLSMLIWTFRADRNVQSWMMYYRVPSVPHIAWRTRVPHNETAGGAAPQEENLTVVKVRGTNTLVISAYQEHRSSQPEVRVIAVVLRSETPAYRCLFCCQTSLHVSAGVCNVHADHFDFPYGTADIMCPVPSGCHSPSQIAVVSADTYYQETLKASDGRCVGEPVHDFMEVKNREAKSDSFEKSFTVCLSTMFDFTNVLQLVQSLEMLQLLGVDRVVVYKTSCSRDAQRVLDHYTRKGLLQVIPMTLSRYVNVSMGWLPHQGPGDLHYMGQIPALNDCLYRYMYRSRYVAMQDIDELILPHAVSSWSDLLLLLESTYGADKCFMFENNVFPINVALPPPASVPAPPRGQWGKVSGVNILDHLHREPIIEETHYTNFKIIVNPRAVFSPSVHGVLESQSGCCWVDRNIARLHHTRNPKQPELTPDELIYDGRLLSYGALLRPAVDTALKESGLLPEDDTH